VPTRLGVPTSPRPCEKRRRTPAWAPLATISISAALGLSISAALGLAGCAPSATEAEPLEDWRAAVHAELSSPSEGPDAASAEAAEEIHAPLALEGLPSGLHDVHGAEIPISCETCHSAEGLIVPAPRAGDEPEAPHAGFRFDHGERPCTACHDADDRSRLRLADGTTLPMREAMQLCAQCHGPQYRAYRHGAHGGMRGHWDPARGPRLRNHCVDCHDPHAPAIPPVAPMPAPRDRFRPASGDHARGTHDGAAARRADEAHEEGPHD
jgi:hypothetical protein